MDSVQRIVLSITTEVLTSFRPVVSCTSIAGDVGVWTVELPQGTGAYLHLIVSQARSMMPVTEQFEGTHAIAHALL